VDISLLIRQRLEKLGLEQKDLASAAEVTESYISQLLTRKKAPPAPGRTDIYEKLGVILQLPSGELAKLAEQQRQEELRKKVGDAARPLFQECRELVLRKCAYARRDEIERIFVKQAFGELERLITQTLLEAAQRVAKAELRNEEWLRHIAPASGRGYEETRVAALEFLDTDIVDVSAEGLIWFLDPLIDCWDIDLKTFAIDVELNARFSEKGRARFAFREEGAARPVPGQPESEKPVALEPGFAQFQIDPLLSGDATEEEMAFLKRLRFGERRPTALYYYRELQSLRDPLHFGSGVAYPSSTQRASKSPFRA
jgi:transcriptional regulator with XRE-family HTH domain